MASGGVSPAHSLFNEPTPSGTLTPSKLSQELMASRPTKICVFCGSRTGTSPSHMEAARQLGRVMAANDIALVFGGGTVGLMGELARTIVSISGPGSVHGIIPAPLVKYERGPDSDGVASHASNGNLPEEAIYGRTTVVPDMHTRKQMMAKEVLEAGPGSGFVALSGGYGTLEEIMEVVTWNQLGIHQRGCVLLNIDGYWDGLLSWVRGAAGAGFVSEENVNIIAEAKTGEETVAALRNYQVSAGRFKLEWGDK